MMEFWSGGLLGREEIVCFLPTAQNFIFSIFQIFKALACKRRGLFLSSDLLTQPGWRNW